MRSMPPHLKRLAKPPALRTTALDHTNDSHQPTTDPVEEEAGSGIESASKPIGAQGVHANKAARTGYDRDQVTATSNTDGAPSRSPLSPFRKLKTRALSGRIASPGRSAVGKRMMGDQGSPRTATAKKQSQKQLEEDEGQAWTHAASTDLPWFLTQSKQDIELKFQDIQWEERTRVAKSEQVADSPDYHYSVYRNPQLPPRMNRYFNIKPYHYNRVKLRVPEGQLDYLNASHIKFPAERPENVSSTTDAGPTKKDEIDYIAMQGPTAVSFSSVWRMISEQTTSPAVIVQLTNFYESGMPKCDVYFPLASHASTDTLGGSTARDGDNDGPERSHVIELNEEDQWQDGWRARVRYEPGSFEELIGGAVQKRKLLLEVDGDEEEDEPRIIWHLLYTRWPDFGVPDLEDTKAFSQLIDLSNQHNSSGSPKIMHCSAGVGRTGTFIALERCIQALHDGTFDDWGRDTGDERRDYIFNVVEDLRAMRRTMVQSEAQFHFLYSTMKMLWEMKNAE